MKTFLLAPLILAAFGAAPAFAGGRPVMYVVVDRVETTQDQSSISMIRIWGSFTRAKNPTLQLADFSKPIDGYIQFGRGSDKEAPKWQKAAGTGKAVLVGCCAGAGAFETVVIHPANEKPKDGGENIPYPTGHLERFGDMFAGGRDDYRPEVKTLLAFVSAKQKVCPLCGGASSTVANNPGPQPVDDALVGQWTVEFANGVVETCDLVKEGTANVVEPKRSSPGKVRDVMNGVVVLAFDDDRIERWTKIGQRMVVEHWASSDQFPSGPPVLGIAAKMKSKDKEQKEFRSGGEDMTLAVRKTLLGKWKIAMESDYKGEWKFNVDGTVDSSTNGAKAGKWTIDLSKKQVLIKWNSDAADKLDLPLDPKSTTGSQVGRNNYKLEAVKVP
jgi:hypothetical protein